MWAGVRWGSTIDPCSPCPSRRRRDGTDGWLCRAARFGAHGARPPRGRVSPRLRLHAVHHAGYTAQSPRRGRRAHGRARVPKLRQPTALRADPNQSLTRNARTVNCRRLDARGAAPPSAMPAGPAEATGGSVPHPQQAAVSPSLGRPRQGSMPRMAQPSGRRGPGASTHRSAQPPASSRRQTRRGRPHAIRGRARAATSPYSGTGVIRANPGQSGGAAGVPGGSGGSPGRTVRRLGDWNRPAQSGRRHADVSTCRTSARGRPRQPGRSGSRPSAPQAPPRQQPVAAPSQEASAPASSSGAAAASPRRGSGAGDSGRARRR